MTKPTSDTLLKFPCEFSIKAMGKVDTDFECTVIAIVRKHYPQLGEAAVVSKLSKNKNYLSLTITITAESKDQLDAIYQDLTDHELVLVAL